MTEQEEKQAIKEVLFDYNAETIEFADEIADRILRKLNELRKPSKHKTNDGDDFTNDKIIFGTLPDGTNVITVIGKNIRNESYIRQQVGVHRSVFDVLKKKIESKASEPDKELLEALKHAKSLITLSSMSDDTIINNAISKYESK